MYTGAVKPTFPINKQTATAIQKEKHKTQLNNFKINFLKMLLLFKAFIDKKSANKILGSVNK